MNYFTVHNEVNPEQIKKNFSWLYGKVEQNYGIIKKYMITQKKSTFVSIKVI